MLAVTISISTDRRLERTGDLVALVRAVLSAASDEPETDALEWKGPLDLSSRKSKFDLARHILGFGNRDVADARRSFEGHAYLLFGVEPGNLCGVAIPDPATLTNALGAFVAPGHPSWCLHRVEVEGMTVAAIEVFPPADGDRICALQGDYDKARAGRIFVRRTGQTEEASPHEVRALEERYAAAAIEEARRATQLYERGSELAERQVAQGEERDARERDDRAAREAPDFVSSRQGNGFAHVLPDTVKGMVRNNGGTAAEITDLRLLHPNGAAPGSAVPVYGHGPAGDFDMPVRIDKGCDVMLRFVHAALVALAQHDGPLTVELTFSSDSGRQWRQELTLRRNGADHQGRRLWTVRENESEIDRWR
jgi:hypothetical protein